MLLRAEPRAAPKRSFVRAGLVAAVAFFGLVSLASSSGPRAYVAPAGPVAYQVAYAEVPAFSRAASPELMAKGFGAPPPKPKPAPKKSAGAAQRDKAAQDFDNLKASGSPEYMVLVREAATDGAEPSNWYPVGGIAVPRSSSLDNALSIAIYNNEEDLLKGAYRAHPFLKKSTKKLEYGYRVKDFPDDPVKVANPDAAKEEENPVKQWFNALDNPLNDGSGWFNPLKRNQ